LFLFLTLFSHVPLSLELSDKGAKKKKRTEKRARKHHSNLTSRAEKWLPIIKEESFFVKLIGHIIDAEISYISMEEGVDTASTTLYSLEHRVNAQRQAAHAYHALYRGAHDEVIVQ